MQPFLKKVALAYAAEHFDDLAQYCFIFPNRRSATFFQHYLSDKITLPDSQAITMGAFVQQFSDFVKATRIEQLFVLYNEYKKLVRTQAMEFDQFCFWGNMILDDFNEIDRFMVPAEQLYRNLHDFKEIRSGYLTEELAQIIARYWNEEILVLHPDDFWAHVKRGDEHNIEGKFLRLWEILTELYVNFHQALTLNRRTTTGNLYRNAAITLKQGDETADSILRYKRYIFVGFNTLSTSELVIFDQLKRRQNADFYWDVDSPYFDESFNPVVGAIKTNKKNFPSRYELQNDSSDCKPRITVTGIPGYVAQVDYISSLLSKWTDEKVIENPDNAVDTAVILPDESIFTSLLAAIPNEIGNVNVTMGLPMKENPVSALIRSISLLQQRASLNKGQLKFYYEDVVNVISFPQIRNVSPAQCDRLQFEISENRLFQLSEPQISEIAPDLAEIFIPIKKNDDIEDVTAYLAKIIDIVRSHTSPIDKMALSYLNNYGKKLEEISRSCATFGIRLRGTSLFRMVERAVGGGKIHFEGEPISGLQIMGVQETLSLDFKNIVIPSMNEGVFPKKYYTQSFIPDVIRLAYGLPPAAFQENVIAYLFYRIISEANNVELIYDARAGGMRSGEFSRYLSQLLYFDKDCKINHRLMSYDILTSSYSPLEIDKTDDVMEKLNLFKAGATHDKRFLSASSLNTYIACPLQFYLRYVERYDASDEMQDYIDASTYGTILHDVAQAFYEEVKRQNSGRPITGDLLQKYISPSDTTLDRLIRREVNKTYHKKGPDNDDPLTGESYITASIIKEMILGMLRQEMKLIVPFDFIAAEKEVIEEYEVNPSLTVNIHQFIDRIDRIKLDEQDSTLRIVDYKTGSDLLEVPDVDDLFKHSDKNHKAIMQLLFYCLIYSKATGNDEPIMPVIYKMGDIGKSGIKQLKIGQISVTNYRDYKKRFEQDLNGLIEEIFDTEKTFRASDDDAPCKFCAFKSICRREP